MKNILVLIHDDAGQEARFQAALDVTRALNGHLTCLDVVPLPLMVGAAFDAGAGAILLAEERSCESANRGRLEARLMHEGVSWDWIDTIGDYAVCLEHSADMADLIVINRQIDGAWGPDMYGLAGELLIRSGRPVLAVPGTCHAFAACGHALVAWDGSAAAAAALRAAIPLLKLAAAVDIAEIRPVAETGLSFEPANYLARHGVKSELLDLPCKSRSPAEILHKMAGSGRYDCVVMGGFGHRQFLEALFGGVTRQMLRHSAIPLFLAH